MPSIERAYRIRACPWCDARIDVTRVRPGSTFRCGTYLSHPPASGTWRPIPADASKATVRDILTRQSVRGCGYPVELPLDKTAFHLRRVGWDWD